MLPLQTASRPCVGLACAGGVMPGRQMARLIVAGFVLSFACQAAAMYCGDDDCYDVLG